MSQKAPWLLHCSFPSAFLHNHNQQPFYLCHLTLHRKPIPADLEVAYDMDTLEASH